MKKSSNKLIGKAKAAPPKRTTKKAGTKPPRLVSHADAKKLTSTEKQMLVHHERIIEVGLKCYETVGNALAEISAKKLYRAGHKTFEDYCKVRWQMGRAHAYRLMKAAKFLALLKSGGDGKTPLPAHESLVRPIIDGLREPQWIKTWQQALKSTKGSVLTGESVAKEVAKRTGRKARRVASPKAADGKQAQQRVFESIRKLVKAALRKRIGATAAYYKRMMDEILTQLGNGSTKNKPKSKD